MTQPRLAAHWPQAGGLLPEGFERESGRLCVLELEAELGDGSGTGSSAVPDAPGFVRIAVEDNGPGLSPDIADALFDPFVTTKARGTGLGLAISRSIIDAHGGRLWHEALAPGSAFCFTIAA